MENSEAEKSKVFIIADAVNYVSNSVCTKVILKKSTGNVTIFSLDAGQVLPEKTSPFDTFILILDGRAEICINKNSHILEPGHSIIIPAHSQNVIKAHEKFKMISTIIKSGYE